MVLRDTKSELQSVKLCFGCSFLIILLLCSSMCPFHRVWAFKNRLLQCGFPRGHISCSCMCSSWTATSFRAYLSFFRVGPLWAAGGTTFSTSWEGIYLVSEACSPPPSSWTLGSAGLFLSHFSSPPQMLCSFGQKWMCFRATENWLCQTWGAASGVFSKKHPL